MISVRRIRCHVLEYGTNTLLFHYLVWYEISLCRLIPSGSLKSRHTIVRELMRRVSALVCCISASDSQCNTLHLSDFTDKKKDFEDTLRKNMPKKAGKAAIAE